jgi:hypothetical protein
MWSAWCASPPESGGGAGAHIGGNNGAGTRARGHAGTRARGRCNGGAQPQTQDFDEAHGIAPHLMVLARVFCWRFAPVGSCEGTAGLPALRPRL